MRGYLGAPARRASSASLGLRGLQASDVHAEERCVGTVEQARKNVEWCYGDGLRGTDSPLRAEELLAL